MEDESHIEARMRAAMPDLDAGRAGRRRHVLSHFPDVGAGLDHRPARAAEVSSPTIVRLVQKLGFRGYNEYCASLRAEVGRFLTAPLTLLEGGARPCMHPLQAFGPWW
ncbi:MAG: hypothetical protein IPL38_09265 [Rhodobacter sp.]|nr:hypothetical protein [Rhodobacter sp.]